jgi:hypothetical protein
MVILSTRCELEPLVVTHICVVDGDDGGVPDSAL